MTMPTTKDSAEDVRASVREKYGQAAQRVIDGNTDASCCGSSACCGSTSEAWDPITADLYEEGQKAGVPAEALLASLGCGNPTALAQLHEGETVLDLGSGGGIDVLLSAKRVGESGKVYGLDMTDEMLALANENKRRAGAENVEFLKGDREHPASGQPVDVIISNCASISRPTRRASSAKPSASSPGGRSRS
jgi:methylase of polypeptide subunit release factors